MSDLTEQWKKGELEEGYYYLKDNGIFLDYYNGCNFNDTSACEIKEVLAPVPSYEEWQPFTDPYFRGLTTKDITELAKKSIRLTKQHCEDNERIEKLEELLKECRYKIIADLDKARLCKSSVDIEDFEYMLNRIDEVLR